MDITALIIFLAIGGVAGWVAGKLMRGGGFGLVGNIVVGIVGAFLGGWLFGMAGVSIAAGLLGTLIKAVIGAIVLLFIVGLLKRA
ncbi:MAG: GlsB/YeaQ/YmgE family stress response membrane protein [Blastocatellales bacterium]